MEKIGDFTFFYKCTTNNIDKQNLNIQSLKGIAALIVFFSHSLNMYKSDVVQDIMHSPFHLFFDGQCAVIIFFVISGFFYYKKEFSWVKYRRNIIKKLLRIYPAYILIMFLAFIVCNMKLPYQTEIFTDWSNTFWKHSVPLEELLKQLTLIIPSNIKLLNPPIWYMYVEVKMFILMPLVIGLWATKGWKWMYPIWIIVILMPTLPLSLEVTAMFLIGSLARYFINSNIQINNKISIVFWIVSILFLGINDFLGILPNHYTNIIQAVGGAYIVGYLYTHTVKWMENSILIYIGNISYEFYLVHFIVLLFLKSVTLSFEFYLTISFLISLVMAVLIHSTIAVVLKNISYK